MSDALAIQVERRILLIRVMFENLRHQIGISSQEIDSGEGHGGRRGPPYAFSAQGVAMLSSVLRSERAVKGEASRAPHRLFPRSDLCGPIEGRMAYEEAPKRRIGAHFRGINSAAPLKQAKRQKKNA